MKFPSGPLFYSISDQEFEKSSKFRSGGLSQHAQQAAQHSEDSIARGTKYINQPSPRGSAVFRFPPTFEGDVFVNLAGADPLGGIERNIRVKYENIGHQRSEV
ncbi:hypothetical protein B0H17DRAFT_1145266 [Mycena rosella]|uniref:Uncharacterized protein n=1 Tax=Mycena rosella TaxID=1033263 RepID=A0AAD7G2I2_MYCRO|nr:hypothetical protein B0H17DRAFT_1145266 [Mycena rosella]